MGIIRKKIEEMDEARKKVVETTVDSITELLSRIKGGIEIDYEVEAVLASESSGISLYSRYYDLAFVIAFLWDEGKVVIQDHSLDGNGEKDVELETTGLTYAPVTPQGQALGLEPKDISNPEGIASHGASDFTQTTFDPYPSRVALPGRIRVGLVNILKSHFESEKDYADFLSGKDMRKKIELLPKGEHISPSQLWSNPEAYLGTNAEEKPKDVGSLGKRMEISQNTITTSIIPKLIEKIRLVHSSNKSVTKENLIKKIDRSNTEWELYKFVMGMSETALESIVKTILEI